MPDKEIPLSPSQLSPYPSSDPDPDQSKAGDSHSSRSDLWACSRRAGFPSWTPRSVTAPFVVLILWVRVGTHLGRQRQADRNLRLILSTELAPV